MSTPQPPEIRTQVVHLPSCTKSGIPMYPGETLLIWVEYRHFPAFLAAMHDAPMKGQ